MNQLTFKGYVHSVSPTKKSREKSFPYFNFSLQVDENRQRRVVCYDSTKQKLLKGYEDSRQPVTLQNVAQKRSLRDPSEEDIILNKRSRLQPANNSDITFEYDETSSLSRQQLTTIANINCIEENQLTSVQGTLTLCKDSVQQTVMNDGFLVPMLTRCTITDDTGTIRLTLWGSAIEEVSNNNSYTITNVRVKSYNSTKYLTTTPSSEITPSDQYFSPPTEQMFNKLFDAETIRVDNIRLADTFKTWLACSKCKKQITDITSSDITLMKCPTCSVVQPVSSCTVNASLRIAVRHDQDHELIWLKVFTSVLQKMLLHPSPDVTIQSQEEEIYTQLFQLENFTIDYDEHSLIVKDVHFAS